MTIPHSPRSLHRCWAGTPTDQLRATLAEFTGKRLLLADLPWVPAFVDQLRLELDFRANANVFAALEAQR